MAKNRHEPEHTRRIRLQENKPNKDTQLEQIQNIQKQMAIAKNQTPRSTLQADIEKGNQSEPRNQNGRNTTKRRTPTEVHKAQNKQHQQQQKRNQLPGNATTRWRNNQLI